MDQAYLKGFLFPKRKYLLFFITSVAICLVFVVLGFFFIIRAIFVSKKASDSKNEDPVVLLQQIFYLSKGKNLE